MALGVARILQQKESLQQRIALQSKVDIPVPERQQAEDAQRRTNLAELEPQRRREMDEYAKNSIQHKIKGAQVN